MDIGVLADYLVVAVIGICLCVGYVIKKLDFVPNKFIPLIMLILGVIMNFWINDFAATPEVLLGGMLSGLASTGMYELFRQFIEKAGTNEEETSAVEAAIEAVAEEVAEEKTETKKKTTKKKTAKTEETAK